MNYSELNHREMCACGHLSGDHYYSNLSGDHDPGFGDCMNCKCAKFRLSVSAPTRVEQQELSRTTINELGAALGRIEAAQAKLPTEEGMSKAFAHLEGEVILRLVDFEHSLANQLARLDERLGAIEKRLEVVDARLKWTNQSRQRDLLGQPHVLSGTPRT